MTVPSFGDLSFAWPWLLLALPLPILARWLLPPVRDAGAALRVPFGSRQKTLNRAKPAGIIRTLYERLYA